MAYPSYLTKAVECTFHDLSVAGSQEFVAQEYVAVNAPVVSTGDAQQTDHQTQLGQVAFADTFNAFFGQPETFQTPATQSSHGMRISDTMEAPLMTATAVGEGVRDFFLAPLTTTTTTPTLTTTAPLIESFHFSTPATFTATTPTPTKKKSPKKPTAKTPTTTTTTTTPKTNHAHRDPERRREQNRRNQQASRQRKKEREAMARHMERFEEHDMQPPTPISQFVAAPSTTAQYAPIPAIPHNPYAFPTQPMTLAPVHMMPSMPPPPATHHPMYHGHYPQPGNPSLQQQPESVVHQDDFDSLLAWVSGGGSMAESLFMQ